MNFRIFPPRKWILLIHLTLVFPVCLVSGADQTSETTATPAAARRLDSWSVIGPGGGGAQFHPAINPHDPKLILNTTDMSEGYISQNGGDSWRMFNLRGYIRWFVWDPSKATVAYAKTTGLFRTSDGGVTWKLVHPSPSNIKKIAAIGDHGSEVIFTRDGSQVTVEALAVDPADSKILYAIMSDGKNSNLSISTDWGESWIKSAELPGGSRKIWIDPRSPQSDRRLIVVSENAVVLRQSGKWIHHPPVNGIKSFNDISLGFDTQGTAALYAVSGRDWRGDNSSSRTILLSRDYGATWMHLEAELNRLLPVGLGEPEPEYQAIACCATQPGIVYISFKGARIVPNKENRFMGVARSSDYGKSWQLVWLDGLKPGPNMHNDWVTERFGPEWGENPFCLEVSSSNPAVVLATDFGRTLRTIDAGKNWYGLFSKQQPNGDWTTTGLDMTTCYGIHFDPFDLKHWFISYTDIGLMESRDSGLSWRSATTRGIPENWVNTTYWMVFDPTVKGRCWAVMSNIHDLPFPKMWRDRGIGHYDGGVAASEDSGRTWKSSSQGMSPTAATDIILDPRSPETARVLYVAGFGSGVWKSGDNGKTWNLKNQGIRVKEPFCWRIVMDSEGVLYLIVARRSFRGEIGNAEDGVLYRSTDGAENWHEVRLPTGVSGPHGIAIDPRDPKRLYLACWGLYNPDGDKNGGILLSEDGGLSWKWIFQRHQHVYDVITDPANPDTLYAGTMTFAVWRSSDRGKNWKRLRGYNFKQTNRVIPDPFHPDKIFITTFGGSVWHGPAMGDPAAAEDLLTPEVSYDVP